jgi:16S rRNA (cytosine967-C5)-methyltransferase
LKVDAARLLAFDLIYQTNEEGAYANIRAQELLDDSSLDSRDRALVTAITYGTLRMQGKLDFFISQVSSRELSSIDAKVRNLLRMGTFQLLYLRMAEHAAINETVQLAKKLVGDSRASFVNAVLRSIQRLPDPEKAIDEAFKDDQIGLLSIKYSHPRWIVQSFFDQLRDWGSVENLLKADNEPAEPHLVAWDGKSTIEELVSEGGTIFPLTHHSVVSAKAPHEYRAIRERRAGVQDAGSALCAELFLATRPATDERIEWLDLCAGPGGKAAFIFNTLRTSHPGDTFIANEISEHRAELMVRNLPREMIRNFDGRDSEKFNSLFDRILVDAPCTGLGALRRRPEARWRRQISDLKSLVQLQRELLDSAFTLLRAGGVLAYVTCSPHLLETKAQILDFLHRHREASLLPISSSHLPLADDGTLQLWTHRDGTDSMYMALIQKPA